MIWKYFAGHNAELPPNTFCRTTLETHELSVKLEGQVPLEFHLQASPQHNCDSIPHSPKGNWKRRKMQHHSWQFMIMAQADTDSLKYTITNLIEMQLRASFWSVLNLYCQMIWWIQSWYYWMLNHRLGEQHLGQTLHFRHIYYLLVCHLGCYSVNWCEEIGNIFIIYTVSSKKGDAGKEYKSGD